MAMPARNGVDKAGRPVYDLSNDEELAAAGDQDAQKRLVTARKLKMRELLDKR